jgi:hypothetical protein
MPSACLTKSHPQPPANAFYRVEAAYAPILRELGLPDAMSVFEHPQIKLWRTLPDRENCTLDATLADGRSIRLHVKRWTRSSDGPTVEERGIRLLQKANIPTVPLAAAGRLPDGRGFVITENLTGHDDAEKLIAGKRVTFSAVSDSLADLIALLHSAGLHHRDLYLCHFFLNQTDPANDIRLIDAARVKSLPRLFARRWIIKDLAQFWYSTLKLPIADADRDKWLARYCRQQEMELASTKAAVIRKSNWIARHDAKLRAAQPTRNVSIPR